jgi:UDP-N-acetyl-D-mannosaminuronic acid transferase (WecB/TagA/CpsF family)
VGAVVVRDSRSATAKNTKKLMEGESLTIVSGNNSVMWLMRSQQSIQEYIEESDLPHMANHI